MNILRSYKKTRLFLWINITGLAIGLAVSIMLILFVVNELSYDKHLANYERIVRLNSIAEEGDTKRIYGINLRKAYTELPEKVPGIEAVTQIYNAGEGEITYNKSRYPNLALLGVDPGFFEVFQMKFIEGTPQNALKDVNSLVITRKQANVIFGSPGEAIGKTVEISGKEGVVSAVVEQFPVNTHFSFDVLVNMKVLDWLEGAQGLEFFTYYLIDANASLEKVREDIVREYQPMMDAWGSFFEGKAYGATEKLVDIYWKSEAVNSLGKSNDMSFVWLLSTLAVLILLLAVANFVNLFISQGETRMQEIGIRKTNGARIRDIVSQFFSEVSLTVLVSFVLGLMLTVILTPYFSKLIQKDIELVQLFNPWFIVCIILLFIITVFLSASYPSFYLSRFLPLDILNKRIKFSKRRLTTAIVIFQSVITITLMSIIWILNSQASFLENMPLGYNPKNVVTIFPNKNIVQNYEAIKNELLALPEVEMVSGANHIIGSGCSGQGIGLLEDRTKNYSINEYRIAPGLAELMQFQLKEGQFFKENAPDSLRQVVLNEAAVKLLGLKEPVAGQHVNYKGVAEVIGVVKDFYYGQPSDENQPLVLSKSWGGNSIYIRFEDHVSRVDGTNRILSVFHKFDPDFIINPVWSEDVYQAKFENLRTNSKIILLASFLSMFIAMMGLIAIHLYATMRRIKEIAIRRINGATSENIFILLSYDIIKWVFIAGVIAIPLAYYIGTEWISIYINRISLSWIIFVFPVLIQIVVSMIVTSGISAKALNQNPVESLKAD